MTHDERVRIWTKRIADYQASGLSKKAWSMRNGVSRNTLNNWLNKSSMQKSIKTSAPKDIKFVKAITPADDHQNLKSTITIQVRNTSIQVGDGFIKDTLINVLRIVNDIC